MAALTIAAAILGGLYLITRWWMFWIERPIDQWITFGFGVPFAILVAILYLTYSKREDEHGD
jgi:hypothetical protein